MEEVVSEERSDDVLSLTVPCPLFNWRAITILILYSELGLSIVPDI